MGLFDFFKKKTNSNSISDNKSNHTSEINKESFINNPENKGKSINEIYAEKLNKQSQDTEKGITQQENNSEVVVEINSTTQGSHGDNFGGLLGFNFVHSERGKSFVIELAALASIQEPVIQNPIANIKEMDFREIGGNSDLLKIRAVSSSNDIISVFPYIRTDYILPFTTKRIFEWSHAANLEAEIQGGGRDTFGLNFFATDYAVNKSNYKCTNDINIRISAICLVLEKSKVTEINETAVADGFAAYMPNTDLQNPSYYNFIGVLLDFTECRITATNSGYIMKIKLINEESNPVFFTVDMFVNKENMRFNDLTKGMQLTGALWFQAELA
jgi:hypothetical protein